MKSILKERNRKLNCGTFLRIAVKLSSLIKNFHQLQQPYPKLIALDVRIINFIDQPIHFDFN